LCRCLQRVAGSAAIATGKLAVAGVTAGIEGTGLP
jgi:hypothetical protein